MALSPMMQHYFSIKEKYKDCIIFYRLGDFYEMFFDDAKKASQLLDLTLTGRDCGLEERAPMCGVPYHAAESYISKLISCGEKVAICEQLEDPSKAKGIVARDVIRVVTPGTLTDDAALNEKSNNYICAVCKTSETIGLAWADITTGELCATQYSGSSSLKNVINQMMKLPLSEVLCNDEMLFDSKDLPEVSKGILPKFSCYLAWTFNFSSAERTLTAQFKTKSLAAFGLEGKQVAVCAAGALLEYLKETQKHALANIDGIKYVSPKDNMQLDITAIKNLELIQNNGTGKTQGSLLGVLDKTSTSMGARLLKNVILSPLGSVKDINYRLDGVEELYNATVVRVGIIENLKQIKDVERLAGKLSNDKITPKDCLVLAQSLLAIPNLKFRLSGFSSRIISDVSDGLYDMSDIADLINSAIEDCDAANTVKDGGYIKKGYNRELDELKRIGDEAGEVINELESRERDVTGIRTLKIRYNRVFGYYIEVSKSFKDKVPTEYQRKQTLANAERYSTDELKALEEKILNSSERSLTLELALFDEIKQKLLGVLHKLKIISENVARLDVLTTFAEVAKNNKYVRPQIVESGMPMIISEGRHPVVEVISKDKFVPNDTLLDEDENRTMIITGPNMAGKSTYMRQTALIAIMAHFGSFVPAKSAQIPLIDRVFTRVGASDNLIYDQSTFMVEMIEVASILQNATKDSLLILDEVGRGTSTYDGLSIAWAVTEHITQKIKAKTLFATHYHELLELEDKMEGVKNYKIAVKEFNGSVVFLRKIMRGGANRSFGIEVASLAGVPACVTERAKHILKSIEAGDMTFARQSGDEETQEKPESEVEKILKEIDLNNLSPMQAFLVLGDLVEKVKK